jgi:hypothetical protein
MNAVDRFSNTLARYRQLPQALPQQAYPQAYPQAAPSLPVYPQQVQSIQPQPVRPQPQSDVEKTLAKVGEGAAVLSRLASLVQRVQNPPAAVTSVQPTPGYPATPPYVPTPGPLGQSLQRLGQAVGDKGVDTFIRQAAPVVDEAIPLIEDIVNMVEGKPRQQAPASVPNPYQPYAAPAQSPSVTQQVAPIVDGVTSLVSGVGSLVKAFEGLFKR